MPGLSVRPVTAIEDCAAINQIYLQCRMVPADVDLMWDNSQTQPHMVYLVVTDDETGAVVGTVTGIDHAQLFGDEENGSSLWCLAVDPTLSRPGVGGLLVRSLIEEFIRRGRVADGPVGAARQRGRHRALRADGLRPRAGARDQAQERHQRKALRPSQVRRGTLPTQSVRPDHRRRGHPAWHRRPGARRQGRLPQAHARRHQRGHPRVAVRAHQRRRDEPLRRQARRPQGRRRGGHPGAARAGRRRSPTRTTSSSTRWARWW